ncbi:MAG: hydantoinase/oxoprolinase family protein [Pseudomonadota bacterium]
MGEDRKAQVVGVDVGGTFTDLIRFDPASGRIGLTKVPSTPENQADGVMAAISTAEVALDRTSLIVHGTTATTNAVLERKLSPTGLITTLGFRDVLELGRRTRPQPYGMVGEFTPIIPRDLRLEVPERMDAEGRVLTPLDRDAVAEAGRALLAAGCVSVAVHFLHASANPAHELAAGEVLAGLWPNAHITLGHRLLSEAREFERGVTAAVNASVQPLLARYVDRLSGALAQGGYGGELLIMTGNGGMVAAPYVAAEAAKTVMSGPASGVTAAAYTGRQAGVADLITYDMGGTSTDVAVIRGAVPAVSNEIELEYAMPIHVPMVDVRTLGAGGGSVARVGATGLLEVGPESAGADPGPICYGRGGTQPTISDANLMLGRLDPGGLRGVAGAPLPAVEARIGAVLATKLGLTPMQAAEAVLRVANTKMAGAIRMVLASLGADPRDFALFAFGGAGPLHAAAIARELGVPRVMVPARPGLTNALGCVVADLRQDFVRTLNRPLQSIEITEVHQGLAMQRAEGEAMLSRQNIALTGTRTLHALDMQFAGQTHLIRVALETATPSRAEIQTAFEAAYWERFRVRLDRMPAMVVNLVTSVIGTRAGVDLACLLDPEQRRATLAEAQTGQRQVVFDGTAHATPLYAREALPAAAEIPGPAIVEQMDTTILIPPGDRARGDAIGNLILEVAP